MTDRKPSLADLIAALNSSMQPHARPPVEAPATRKETDSPPPGGTGEFYRRGPRSLANRKSGGGSVHFKPNAVHFANNPTPPTSRVSAAGVSKGSGRRLTPGKPLAEEKANSESAGYRQALMGQHNFAQSVGEITRPGIKVTTDHETRCYDLAGYAEYLAEQADMRRESAE